MARGYFKVDCGTPTGSTVSMKPKGEVDIVHKAFSTFQPDETCANFWN
jgi:hypothetical protein